MDRPLRAKPADRREAQRSKENLARHRRTLPGGPAPLLQRRLVLPAHRGGRHGVRAQHHDGAQPQHRRSLRGRPGESRPHPLQSPLAGQHHPGSGARRPGAGARRQLVDVLPGIQNPGRELPSAGPRDVYDPDQVGRRRLAESRRRSHPHRDERSDAASAGHRGVQSFPRFLLRYLRSRMGPHTQSFPRELFLHRLRAAAESREEPGRKDGLPYFHWPQAGRYLIRGGHVGGSLRRGCGEGLWGRCGGCLWGFLR